MIADLTYDSFAPHIGSGFAISSDGYDDVLTLVSIDRGPQGPATGRQPFSLNLRGGRTDVMYNSMMFVLTHPEMGAFELFINPTGKNADGTVSYEVPFN